MATARAFGSDFGATGATLSRADRLARLAPRAFQDLGIVLLVALTYIPETARQVAERVRHAIAAASFAPDGIPHPLSVSIGAAYFESGISFSELFRIADQLLYGAKQMGRNRVQVAHAVDHPPVRVEAPGLTGAAA